MKTTNLVYVFNPQGQILLCAKKKTNSGFDVSLGKRNGAGGKVDPGETPLISAHRELLEETGISVPIDQFIHQGIIYFDYAEKQEWNQLCYIYAIKNYSGDFQETEEMKPQRFSIDQLPYGQMRGDDRYRMPRFLAGEYIEYKFFFDEQGNMLEHYETIR